VGVALGSTTVSPARRTPKTPFYDELCEETDITANLVQKGIRRAIEAVSGGVEKLEKGADESTAI
jgi:hypothetical protein